MTVIKPTLLAFSPGHPVGYVVTQGDYNNDTLQQGAWTQLMLGAQTSFPASPAAGDTCPRSDLNAWYLCTNATGPVWNQMSVGAFTTAARPAAPPTNYRYMDLTDGAIYKYNGTTYDGAWIAPTLLNSWVNFGGGTTVAGYSKDAQGTVRVRGLVASGTSAAANVFTLQTGYRPAGLSDQPGVANNLFAMISIGTSGNCVFSSGGSTTWSSFDGCEFDTR